MAELKTKKTAASVEKFLNGVSDEQRRKDCFSLVEIMKAATKANRRCGEQPSSGLGGINIGVDQEILCRSS
jgi:hypothetical protein